jgi:hypothetical protein
MHAEEPEEESEEWEEESSDEESEPEEESEESEEEREILPRRCPGGMGGGPEVMGGMGGGPGMGGTRAHTQHTHNQKLSGLKG